MYSMHSCDCNYCSPTQIIDRQVILEELFHISRSIYSSLLFYVTFFNGQFLIELMLKYRTTWMNFVVLSNAYKQSTI